MALWDGLTLNTNELTHVFNQMWMLKSVPMVVRRNPLLYKILGKQTVVQGATGPQVSFERLNKITGSKIEFRLLGKLPSPSYVADGSAELATATPTYTTDLWGNVTFDISHMYSVRGIPSSELHRFAGDEAKTRSYVTEVFETEVLGYEKSLSASINSETSAPARDKVGSWLYAVDDGTDYAIYGGLNRADSANVDFRGNVTRTVGTLSIQHIQSAQNACLVRNGKPSVGVCAETVYGIVQRLAEAYTTVQYDSEMSKFGAPNVQISGITFMLEPDAPSGTLGLLDPSTFGVWMKEVGMNASFVKDITRPAAHILNWESWVQFLCKKPNSNAKLVGITG